MSERGPDITSPTQPAGSGRPRDDRLTATIIEAAHELTLECGYDNLRIKDVAKRAGTGIDTIYRRWDSKTELFIDVLRSTPPVDHQTGADAVEDLRSDVAELAESVRDWSSYFAGLATAAREHPALGQTVADKLRVQTDVLGRKIADLAKTSEPERARFAAETIMALLMYRAAFSGDTIAPEKLSDELIDSALAIADRPSTQTEESEQ